MRRKASGWIAGLAMLTVAAGGPPASTAAPARNPIRTPGVSPEVLAQVVGAERLSAFAISADGSQAALATESSDKPDHSDLKLFSTAEGEALTERVPGRIRDLLFATDGSVLYGILHRSARRTGGDTYLVLINPETLKVKRGNRLPIGATDLDHWVTARALLIAAPSEIRTLLLPDLRSGPLFPVTGANRAVASIGGGSLILVGQDDGIDVVDLEDRPGIEEMPVREHLKTAGPIQGLAVAADGKSALARQADGSLLTVEFRPLRSRPAGTGSAVAAPPVVAAIRPAPTAMQDVVPPVARKKRPESEAQPPVRPAPPAKPAPAPPAKPEDNARRTSEGSPVTTAPSEPPSGGKPTTSAPQASQVHDGAVRVPPRQVPPPATSPGAPEKPPEPPARGAAPRRSDEQGAIAGSTTPADMGQVSGRITGGARDEVRFVVVRGPNNLLRESARVVPGPDGSWSVDGLAPGRYRIQLDAGGGRVMVSLPPFLLIEITESGRSIRAGDIEARRIH